VFSRLCPVRQFRPGQLARSRQIERRERRRARRQLRNDGVFRASCLLRELALELQRHASGACHALPDAERVRHHPKSSWQCTGSCYWIVGRTSGVVGGTYLDVNDPFTLSGKSTVSGTYTFSLFHETHLRFLGSF
jgi:hypothetical protein